MLEGYENGILPRRKNTRGSTSRRISYKYYYYICNLTLRLTAPAGYERSSEKPCLYIIAYIHEEEKDIKSWSRPVGFSSSPSLSSSLYSILSSLVQHQDHDFRLLAFVHPFQEHNDPNEQHSFPPCQRHLRRSCRARCRCSIKTRSCDCQLHPIRRSL